MKKRTPYVIALAFMTSALLLSTVTSVPTAQAPPNQKFSQAELFFELNDTDDDLGIHSAIDGSTWTELEIKSPSDRVLFDLDTGSRLKVQGLTQLAFESAEPSFDELDPADFFRRFPEGRYKIKALAQDGSTVQGAATISHVLAAPPENITLSGIPAPESCDDLPLPTVTEPVLIRWDPVTESHPEIGKEGQVSISKYQVFVERANVSLAVDLPPTITQFEVPTGVTSLGNEFKFEIIARTTTGNNTAIESCFRIQ